MPPRLEPVSTSRCRTCRPSSSSPDRCCRRSTRCTTCGKSSPTPSSSAGQPRLCLNTGDQATGAGSAGWSSVRRDACVRGRVWTTAGSRPAVRSLASPAGRLRATGWVRHGAVWGSPSDRHRPEVPGGGSQSWVGAGDRQDPAESRVNSADLQPLVWVVPRSYACDAAVAVGACGPGGRSPLCVVSLSCSRRRPCRSSEG
jgi:hypothetical protein